MPPSILTIPAAARLLGIPRRTLWAWIHSRPQWQACVSHRNGRRAYLSTDRLHASGLLVPAESPADNAPPLADADLRAVLRDLQEVGKRLEAVARVLLTRSTTPMPH